ncbi:MAG: EamA family transporter [Rhodospirillaceae bacterium]|nr:EamA family transporter [Rhodospirillaceae bacterium]
MSVTVLLLVLAAAIMHATWNAMIKSGRDRVVDLTLVIGGAGFLAMLAIPFVGLPDPAAWPWIGVSVVTHVGYYIFLLFAYRDGAMSRVYPIARGIAPPLVAIIAIPLAGEVPDLLGAIGLGLVTVGILVLAIERGNMRGAEGRSVLFAVITGLFIVSYVLADGMGVRASGDPAAYIAWDFFLESIPLVVYCIYVKRHSFIAHVVHDGWRGLFGAVIAGGGYAIAIWAMSLAPMAQVTALRETSVVFGAAIGALILKEPFGPRRIAAAVLVAFGNALIQF